MSTPQSLESYLYDGYIISKCTCPDEAQKNTYWVSVSHPIEEQYCAHFESMQATQNFIDSRTLILGEIGKLLDQRNLVEAGRKLEEARVVVGGSDPEFISLNTTFYFLNS